MTNNSNDETIDDVDEHLLNNNGTITVTDSYSGQITLVGTVHVSKITRERVLDTIEDVQPDTVAIELDSERLYKMFERGADIVGGDVTNKVGLQSLMRKQQEQMVEGNENLLRPGEADMLPAANTAIDMNKDIALIDMSVDELKSNVKNNAFSDGKIDIELFNKSSDEIIYNIKSLLDSRMDMATMIKNDGISKYVENMETAPLSEINTQFEPIQNLVPEFVDALIDERDKYMAGQLHWLRTNDRDVVSVMGKGHLNGVYNYLVNPEDIPDEYIAEPDWYNYSTISIN